MAVGYQNLPALAPVAGVRLATARAGIKQPNRRDLVLFELAEGSRVAAVFTRNRFRAAPVSVAEAHLAQGDPRYWLINTGYANAGTGAQGLEDAHTCCQAVAAATGCAAEQVVPFSTGIIAEPLPVERITAAVPDLVGALSATGWADAAHGIMTTDTVAKGVTRDCAGGYRITGIVKGSGMIRPNMATMLAFLATDADVTPELLDEALRAAVAQSFHRITVDGDTSTNDASIVAATGASNTAAITARGPGYDAFVADLTAVCVELAQLLVRDAEGATRFVAVEVSGAKDSAEGEQVAFSVAQSPLVKTALFAGDPNWGRILAAVGRAGIDDLDTDQVSVSLGDLPLAANGARLADYREDAAATLMAREEIVIGIDLGRGGESVTVWTCDFSYDYVRINAEYRS